MGSKKWNIKWDVNKYPQGVSTRIGFIFAILQQMKCVIVLGAIKLSI